MFKLRPRIMAIKLSVVTDVTERIFTEFIPAQLSLSLQVLHCKTVSKSGILRIYSKAAPE